MEKIMSKIFLDYLSGENVSKSLEYTAICRKALSVEEELRSKLSDEQAKCFEELLEATSQIHSLEVKDAFSAAFKLGAKLSKEIHS